MSLKVIRCKECGHVEITDAVKQQMLKMYQSGTVQKTIAEQCGISQAHVSKILKKLVFDSSVIVSNLADEI